MLELENMDVIYNLIPNLSKIVCVYLLITHVKNIDAGNIEYRSKFQKTNSKPISGSLMNTTMADSVHACMGHCNKQDGCHACVWSSGDGACSLYNSVVISESLEAGESGFVVVSTYRHQDPGNFKNSYV